ncbi:MAG: hypothetical protein ACK4GQ_03725 [Candidatus Hadarchaeales archaeon]
MVMRAGMLKLIKRQVGRWQGRIFAEILVCKVRDSRWRENLLKVVLDVAAEKVGADRDKQAGLLK